MIEHLRSSSDRIGKFSFDSIYSLTAKKSIYLLDIVYMRCLQMMLFSIYIGYCEEYYHISRWSNWLKHLLRIDRKSQDWTLKIQFWPYRQILIRFDKIF